MTMKSINVWDSTYHFTCYTRYYVHQTAKLRYLIRGLRSCQILAKPIRQFIKYL